MNALMTLLITVLLLRVGLSTELYNLMVPYVDPGGSPLVKIHPATYLLLAFAPLFLLPKPSSFRQRGEGVVAPPLPLWMVQFLGVVTAIAFINVVRFGTAGMAYMLDTLIMPTVYILLMSRLTSAQRYTLAKLVVLLVVVNSIMALIEFAGRFKIIPHGRYMFEDHFRSSALFGHPLTSCLITGPVALVALAMPWKNWQRYGAVGLMLLAILAFGGRSALLFGTIVLVLSVLMEAAMRAKQGKLQLGDVLTGYGLFALATTAILALMLFTPLGDRFIGLGLVDESTQTRFTSFQLLTMLSPAQLWGGVDFSTYQLMLDLNPDLTIIENYWINMLVFFGIPLFAAFAGSFLWLCYGLAKDERWYLKGAVISFIVLSSINNSLNTKTLAPLLILAAIYGICRKPVGK